ncbi:MAG: lactonase family protein [Bacteroidales bacterium]|nr:lactonase family protein [Bacteroidales bacterium]
MKQLSLFINTSLLALSTMALISCTGSTEPAQSLNFYVGSSKGSLSHSIYLCRLDPAAQEFTVADSFAGARGGSYLALSPGNHYLFSINQASVNGQGNESSVSSFAIDPADLSLKLINSRSSKGSGICHIHCSRTGDYIFAANYGSGHVSALPVRENGEIGTASSVVSGEGSGPVKSRQEGPHAHQAVLDPGQNFLLVPDLGTDKVFLYSFDEKSGILSPNPAQAFFELAPGAGPRHLAFHPDGHSLYIVNELNSTLTACSYEGSKGRIKELNTVLTVDSTHQGMRYPAAVRVHPNGKYLYASTRGENSCISTFKIREDGTVSRIQVVEQVPAWPRDFNLDPSGKIMLVAGERSDEIMLYLVDPLSGILTKTGAVVKLPAPASILFVP